MLSRQWLFAEANIFLSKVHIAPFVALFSNQLFFMEYLAEIDFLCSYSLSKVASCLIFAVVSANILPYGSED